MKKNRALLKPDNPAHWTVAIDAETQDRYLYDPAGRLRRRYDEDFIADSVVELLTMAASEPWRVDERWYEMVKKLAGPDAWDAAVRIFVGMTPPTPAERALSDSGARLL